MYISVKQLPYPSLFMQDITCSVKYVLKVILSARFVVYYNNGKTNTSINLLRVTA